ncbi:MAG: cupin domain-containing protein [Actinobacteria bacterium]|nr:cupin domain-containing protein [Cyanobacteriota bacterium]MCL5771203.1 cupin domain-containing protein [Actinomycetota bacterium]
MKIKKRKELTKVDIKDNNAKDVNFYPAITARDGAPIFALRLFEIESNGYTPFHSHKWEHEVYIIEGNGFLKGEKEEYIIEKNNFIFVEPEEFHQFIAGGKGLRMICIVPNIGQQ